MRLTGFVTLNGVRTALDWTITGTSVNAGPGLPADHVNVHVSLPDYTNSSGTSVVAEATLSENPTGGLWDLTVTDLRLALKAKSQPIYGNKRDLIERLEAAPAEPPAEATAEGEQGEVNEDGETAAE